MSKDDKQKFIVYAVPCNRPFVIDSDKLEEFKEQSLVAYKDFKEKMKEMELEKLNIRMEVEEVSELKLIKRKKER